MQKAAQAETGRLGSLPRLSPNHCILFWMASPSMDLRYPGWSSRINPLLLKQTEFLLRWGMPDPGLGDGCYGKNPRFWLCL